MERLTRNLGRMIGDNQLQRTTDAAWESQGLSASEGERGGPQHPGVRAKGVMSERSPEEGVPQVRRPRLRQVGCETCCLRLEQYQRLLQCHGRRNWIHEGCVEQLDIGTSWHADMCLTCKFKATRMLRVVSAVELSQGHSWNQDDWFVTLLNQLSEGSGYGASRNKDLNELEICMAKP